MTTLAILTLAVLATQTVFRRRALRRAAQMIQRPAAQWTDADTQRWLDLIEPFPLHAEGQESRW